jgi:3',5'-cyclic AMP phosphodiesterase CpdA
LILETGRDVLFVPGNHDIGDGPNHNGDPSDEPLDLARVSDYRRIFGPDWWSVQVEDWQLLGLNAQLLGTGSAEETAQDAWLEETLRAATGPLGVMIHKPLYPLKAVEASGRYPQEAARAHLATRLKKRDLRFIASGHTHQALSCKMGDTEQVWVPSTAFCIPEAMQETVGEKKVGAVILELQDGRHRFSFAAPPGLMRHNLLDLSHIYPQVIELRAELGPACLL